MIVTTSMLKHRYRDYANPLDKIKRDADRGILIRLTRGLYETSDAISPSFLASAILSPSYLSFDYALSYYGLIPEKVVCVTSASLGLRKNKTFVNAFGRYTYSDIPATAFFRGLILYRRGRLCGENRQQGKSHMRLSLQMESRPQHQGFKAATIRRQAHRPGGVLPLRFRAYGAFSKALQEDEFKIASQAHPQGVWR